MKKLLADLPKKGEVSFVHYYHETEPGSDVIVRAKGSPFKANIVAVNFEDEGIMYTCVTSQTTLHMWCTLAILWPWVMARIQG
jgi:hypothetical protein